MGADFRNQLARLRDAGRARGGAETTSSAGLSTTESTTMTGTRRSSTQSCSDDGADQLTGYSGWRV